MAKNNVSLKREKIKPTLTAEYIRDILDYDSKTGVFTWKNRADSPYPWNQRWSGKTAGRTKAHPNSSNQGKGIRINNWEYQCSLLAWLYIYSEWSDTLIDHKNGNRFDDSIDSLRKCTRLQNNQNRKPHKDGVSKYKGVWCEKRRNHWVAEIKTFNGKIHLGSFHTEKRAAKAYDIAAKKYFGEFAYLNFHDEVSPT